MRKLLPILFLFFLQNSFAQIIYVSPSGNDVTGDGSIGNPYASLYRASGVSTSGNTIYFKAGTYTESNKITIPAGVNIDGDGRSITEISSTYPASGGAYDYWINLVSAVENTNGNQFIRNVTFDGSNTTCFNGIIVTARSNVAIYNCTIKNFKLAGVYWRGSLQSYGTEPINYAVNNTFYNNIVDNCSNRMYPDSISNGGSGGGLLWISGQQDMIIHDNLLSDTSRVTGRNGDIIFSVEGNMKGLKYYNNESWIDPNISTLSGNVPWNISLEFWNDRGGMEFYNNIFHGGGPIDQGGNLQIKGAYAYSFWIHDNTFIRDGGQLLVRGSRDDGAWTGEGVVNDAIFERNKVVNLSENGASIIIGYTGNRIAQNNVIRNNLFLNMGYANSASAWSINIGMNRQSTNVYDTIQNIYVYNNTFKNLGGGKCGGIVINNDSTVNVLKRIYIQNNTFLDANGYGYLTFYETQGSGNVNAGLIDSVFSNHNIIYNCGNADTAFYRQASNTNGSRNTTNTKFYAASNINLDPLLDATTYLPLPGSPAIGAAINVGLPTNNIGYYGSIVPIITSGGSIKIQGILNFK